MFILAWVAGAERRKGGGGGRRKITNPPLFPFHPIPYPFRRLLCGLCSYWSLPGEPITQQEEKKRWGRGCLLLFCFLGLQGILICRQKFSEGLRKNYVFLCSCTASFRPSWSMHFGDIAVWGTSAEIPHWWPVTTQVWVVFLIGWNKSPSNGFDRLLFGTNFSNYPDLGNDVHQYGISPLSPLVSQTSPVTGKLCTNRGAATVKSALLLLFDISIYSWLDPLLGSSPSIL